MRNLHFANGEQGDGEQRGKHEIGLVTAAIRQRIITGGQVALLNALLNNVLGGNDVQKSKIRADQMQTLKPCG